MIIITHDSHYKHLFIISQPTIENCSRFIWKYLKTMIFQQKQRQNEIFFFRKQRSISSEISSKIKR